MRGHPGNRLTVAVGGDARPETAINALLDLLAWQWQLTVEQQKPGDVVDLLVGDGPNASQILDALRTLVATHAGRPRIDLHLVAKPGTTLRSREANGPELAWGQGRFTPLFPKLMRLIAAAYPVSAPGSR